MFSGHEPRENVIVKDMDKPQFPLTNNSMKTDMGSSSMPPNTSGKSRFWSFARMGAGISLVVGSLLAGTYAGVLYKSSPTIRSIIGQMGQHPFVVLASQNPLVSFTPEEHFVGAQQHSLMILLLGSDHDYIQNSDPTQPPIPDPKSPARSDSIMIAKCDFDKKTISIISVPRDTAVSIPGHGYQKINAAHAFRHEGITPGQASQQVIRDTFGIDTDYAVDLDFEGFQRIVDSLGGVDVTVHKNLNYDDNWGNLHIHLKPGYQHLNGYKAMGYVRMRHSDSDIMRAERQHEFLEAMRDRVKQPSILWKLPDVLGRVNDSFKSDMNQEQMLTLINFARGIPRENIQLATMPNFEGSSYCYIYKDQARDMIAKMFYDGDTYRVNINAPDKEVVAFLNHNNGGRREVTSQRRHRHSDHTLDPNAPKDDTGNPLTEDNGPPVVSDLTGAGDGGSGKHKRTSDGGAPADTPDKTDKTAPKDDSGTPPADTQDSTGGKEPPTGGKTEGDTTGNDTGGKKDDGGTGADPGKPI